MSVGCGFVDYGKRTVHRFACVNVPLIELSVALIVYGKFRFACGCPFVYGLNHSAVEHNEFACVVFKKRGYHVAFYVHTYVKTYGHVLFKLSGRKFYVGPAPVASVPSEEYAVRAPSLLECEFDLIAVSRSGKTVVCGFGTALSLREIVCFVSVVLVPAFAAFFVSKVRSV